jgi:hypothetical protein
MPPSLLNCSNIYHKNYIHPSVNFYKALYSIFYDHPYFKNCKITYDITSPINMGVAVSIRERCYKLPDEKIGPIREGVKRFFY